MQICSLVQGSVEGSRKAALVCFNLSRPAVGPMAHFVRDFKLALRGPLFFRRKGVKEAFFVPPKNQNGLVQAMLSRSLSTVTLPILKLKNSGFRLRQTSGTFLLRKSGAAVRFAVPLLCYFVGV